MNADRQKRDWLSGIAPEQPPAPERNMGGNAAMSGVRLAGHRRARVLQIAYACGPGRGSEPAVGWHRAVEAARYCDVWVICEGREFRQSIEAYLDVHGPLDGLQFHFVDKPAAETSGLYFPGSYYVAYHQWHRRAGQLARELHRQIRFDLVHQVNLCGFREPGYGRTVDAPFVWGPVGGTQNHPWRNLDQAGARGALQEATRTCLNVIQLYGSRRVREAAWHASLVLAANQTVQRQFERAIGRPVEVMCEIGTPRVHEPPEKGPAKPVRLLWAGECRPFKALPLLLRALRGVPNVDDFQLRVVGDGPDRKRWQAMAARWNLNRRIEWTGWVHHEQMAAHYDWAHALVFTSLRDTTGTVVLEALSRGLPVVGPRHQGIGELVTRNCGLLVPVASTATMVRQYAAALRRLVSDPHLWSELSCNALRRASAYTWRAQGLRMRNYYRRVLGDAFLWTDRNNERRPSPLVPVGACQSEVPA